MRAYERLEQYDKGNVKIGDKLKSREDGAKNRSKILSVQDWGSKLADTKPSAFLDSTSSTKQTLEHSQPVSDCMLISEDGHKLTAK